jgi:hypothetical protein
MAATSICIIPDLTISTHFLTVSSSAAAFQDASPLTLLFRCAFWRLVMNLQFAGS